MYFKPRLKRPPPIMAKRLYFKKRRNTLAFRICAVSLVFIILCVLLDVRLRPIIETVGGNALKNSLTNVVDGAVNEIVDELGVKYGEMVNIEKNSDGTIAALTLNNTAINGYKAELADACSDKLSDFDKTIVPVSLGSLLGGSFLNGRGFDINVRATIYGFAVTDIISKFESAGINQTRHIIYLEVKASAYAYMGLCRLEESVDETIILVETIIIGDVPNSFYIGNEEINYPYIPD